MALYYCTRGDITDMLPSLVGSDISTTDQQDAKLRRPAKEWIDSVYPGVAPFAGVGENDPLGWAVNQSDHSGADSTVTIDGGSGNPAVGDMFRVVGDNQWDATRQATRPIVDDSQEYRVTEYAANVVTYVPHAGIDFVDNAPINFGTPNLVRQAAMLYAVGRGFILLRKNVLDKEAAITWEMAREILHISDDRFLAKARPESTSDMTRMTPRVVSA